MLLLLRAEAERVHQFEGVPQGVAALESVLYLAEDLPDLVFDGTRALCTRLETLEVPKQVAVNKIDQVVADKRPVVVERAVFLFRSRPGRPLMRLIKQEIVALAYKLGLHGPLLFQVIEILEEQYPRCLLGVVQLGGAPGFPPKDVVEVVKGLLEHGDCRSGGK